jgi:hypothetical protein
MGKLIFETDANGYIITKPVTGYVSDVVANMAVILAVKYAEDEEALDRGESKSIQFVLTPKQCFDVAETLTKQAKRIMDDTSGSVQ